VDQFAWIREEAVKRRKVVEVLIREDEMKAVKAQRRQNLDPWHGPPCHGRHFLDDSYLIQQWTLPKNAN
jgi:hypothetical protein